MKIRESLGYLIERMKSQNHDEAITLYNQMYTDALQSRQLQDEESNSLEQWVDALIKKQDLMNHSKKSTFNSHCMQSPHDHEQSVQIGPSSCDCDIIRRQKHRLLCQTTPPEYHNVEQVPLYIGNGDPPSSHNGCSTSGDSEVSSVCMWFACGTDGHRSRFCS